MIECETQKFGHVNCPSVAFEDISEYVVIADEVHFFFRVLKDFDRVHSTEQAFAFDSVQQSRGRKILFLELHDHAWKGSPLERHR